MMCLEPQQEKPAESKFCFLKLPIVFRYVVPFAAISKKQNRKGSPTSLIYPYKGKLTSIVIKQFFTFGRVHQTLMRSRLRRFCSERRKRLFFSAKLRRFACNPELKDDTLTLELLCPFVTLSKAGCTVLFKGTHSKTPAASNLDEWR